MMIFQESTDRYMYVKASPNPSFVVNITVMFDMSMHRSDFSCSEATNIHQPAS